jgi:hypothetical protein
MFFLVCTRPGFFLPQLPNSAMELCRDPLARSRRWCEYSSAMRSFTPAWLTASDVPLRRRPSRLRRLFSLFWRGIHAQVRQRLLSCATSAVVHPQDRMSALGQKRTSKRLNPMSALPPKADIDSAAYDVRFVPRLNHWTI